jgi:L-ascorbate metabolism protein UlaG (beta-lactamase superfamily)
MATLREFFRQTVTLGRFGTWARNIALVVAGIAVMVGLLFWRMVQIRGDINQIGWPESPVATEPGDAVTVTWLGTTTMLFDDGETQVLIDGTFTRLGLLQMLPFRRVRSDVATINYAMSNFGMTRLAAIVPVHSHFDHAMDVGYVANRSSAVVLGSESTANIARGADVPVRQYQILADGEVRQFGDFTIRLLASVHAPIANGREEFFAGIIDMPLRQPAPVSDYRTGVAWSIVIGHPRGTTLVQGSGGIVPGKLAGEYVDVVMLGVAGLSRLGKDYVSSFWDETVTATDAARVIVVHHDDYNLPFGEVQLMPDIFDKVLRTAGWIDELMSEHDSDVVIELPPFGEPVILY